MAKKYVDQYKKAGHEDAMERAIEAMKCASDVHDSYNKTKEAAKEAALVKQKESNLGMAFVTARLELGDYHGRIS